MFEKIRQSLRDLRNKVAETFLPLSEEKSQERTRERELEHESEERMHKIRVELHKHCIECKRSSCEGCSISGDLCDNCMHEQNCSECPYYNPEDDMHIHDYYDDDIHSYRYHDDEMLW